MATIVMDVVRDIDRIRDWDSKILAAAVFYAENGFFVVPIRPDGKALPGKRHNFNYSHASRDPKKVAKWFGEGGTFEGWNIGLATGRRDGIFVVDLDVHDPNANGLENFDEVTPDDYKYYGPVQETPSGGRHLLFNWRENAASSTNKIGPGIDTRGGEPDECKGHIVVWPSKVDGGSYVWEMGGEVPDIPEFIITKMGRPWQTSMGSGRGNEFVGDKDTEDKFSLDHIKGMLLVIDPNELSYDEWLHIGMAIHSQHPTPEAAALWDDWCKQGEKYESHEVSIRWDGFKDGGPIRIGTLIKYAQQRGYELNHIPEPNKDEIDELVAQMNEKYSIVPMGADVFVVEDLVVVPELTRIQPKYRVLKKQAFRSMLENQVMIMGSEKGPVKKSHADIWLAHEDRRTYPSGMGMFPNRPPRYNGYYNLWGGFSIESSPGKWDQFEGHIKNIICSGDEEMYEWVMDWMADLVQDPANPKGCAIVMHGIEGCGKGTFAQFIGELFGVMFKHITDEEHLVGRFNGHMADAVVVFADEVTYGGNRKVAGKLKALVTERYITAERKGVDAVQFYNCAHLLVASNESWFIPAGPQSRRWLVLDVAGDRANDREYFNSMHHQMEQEGGLAAMLYDLQRRKITRDLKKAPETDALKNQRAEYVTMDSVAAWWHHQLSTGVMTVPPIDNNAGDWPEAISKADALNTYKEWCKEYRRRTVSDNSFFKKMVSYGLVNTRFKRIDKRINGYRVPEYADAVKIAERIDGMKIAEEYKDED